MQSTQVLRVLGPVIAERDNTSIPLGGPRQRALLARLVVAAGGSVPIAVLAEEIWSEPTATDSVKTAVSRLRKALGRDAVLHDGHGYALDANSITTDVAMFEAALREARRETASPTARVDLYRAALEIWRGEPFEDVDEEFCVAETSRLNEERLLVLSESIDARLEAGETLSLVPQLEHLVAEHPWRETFTEQLVIALYRGGRQRDALTAYRRLETVLREELGIAPNPRLRELEVAVLRQEPQLHRDQPTRRLRTSADADGTSDDTDRRHPASLAGRDDELGRLRRSWRRVRETGDARLIVIAGPPGIGKSTLLHEFVELTSTTGATVLETTCEPSDRIPFQAAASALGPQVARLGARVLEPDLVALAAVVPGVGALPATLPDAGVDPDLRRMRVLRAAERAIELALEDGPVLFALDDLQWIDPASLAFLERVLTNRRSSPLLVVATCRSHELAADSPVTAFLSEAARLATVTTTELDGLDEDAIRAMVSDLAITADAAQVDELVRLATTNAGGNPFFVRELVLHHLSVGDAGASDLAAPTTVHATVAERLGALSLEIEQLLTTAAISGHVVRMDVLAIATALDTTALVELTDPAAGAGLIRRRNEAGDFEFCHAIVRQVLLERTTPSTQARLHATIADALAEAGCEPMELAHHLCSAVPFVPAERAARAAIDAGDHALLAGAFEDAEKLFDRALTVLDRGPDDIELRARAHVGLGNAMASGTDAGPSRAHFEAAMTLARSQRAGTTFAEAILGRAQFGVSHIDRDKELERLTAALELLPPDQPAVRARLLLWGAWQLLYSDDHRRAEPYVDEALRLAADLNDLSTQAAALQVQHALLVAALAPLEERDAVRNRIIALSVERMRYEGSLVNGASVFDDLLEHGDLATFRRELERYRRDADELGRPYERWSSRAMRFVVEMWTGDLEGAEAAMAEADSLGQSLGVEVSRGAAAGQLLLLTWERDELGHVVPLVEQLLATAPAPEPWMPVLTLAYLEAGRIEDARRSAVDIPELLRATPHNQNRAAMASVAAEAVDALRDDNLTAAVEEVLAPHAGRLRVSPTAVLTLGPYDRFLGICALARDDLDTAVERFLLSRQLSKKFGLTIWEPRSGVWEAEARLRRSARGDRETAEDLLLESADAATLIGSELLKRMIADIRERHSVGG